MEVIVMSVHVENAERGWVHGETSSEWVQVTWGSVTPLAHEKSNDIHMGLNLVPFSLVVWVHTAKEMGIEQTVLN